MGGFRGKGVAAIAGALAIGAVLVATPVGVGATEPGAPPGQDFVITPGDLAYVLRQIDISEAHAEATEADPNASPLCSDNAVFDDDLYDQIWREPDGAPCVGSVLLPHGLRTVDGRWNNLQPGQDGYGAAHRPFPRLLAPVFQQADVSQPMFQNDPAAGVETTYEWTSGTVWDSEPREISNLIVDQTTNNPAAVAELVTFLEEGLEAAVYQPTGPGGTGGQPVNLTGLDGDDGTTPDGHISAAEIATLPALPGGVGYPIFLQNVATDEGLSAPFSSWMTIFGQFFDHGLDLVAKGGNGDVIVPLHPDDPLYVAGSHTNFVPLSRATRVLDAQGEPTDEHINRVTPFIDQNQTYTSHSAHQVFLREYELVNATGAVCATYAPGCTPQPTGHLLENQTPGGGLATWADVKDQARSILGIELDDEDVHHVPLVAADPYGRFIPGANGFPTLGNGVEGNPAAPVPTNGPDAGPAFIDDIAHGASPGQVDHSGNAVPYDPALLDKHFVTGDGRGNENVALTAGHHIFHSEHNRLIGQIEAVIAQDVAEGDARGLYDGFRVDGYWDYEERLFQAARFFNEMQYQHLAVEEFLRVVAPTMDAQPVNETAYHSELNAAITAEFAHVVYRFGHSMLTETIPRIYDDGTGDSISLLDGFLNPDAFTNEHDGITTNDLTHDEAAAAVIRGLASQVGNGIDEFTTDTLRNKLLGIPLDLPTINITRARETGVPPLNVARQSFYAATLDPTLAPYQDWADFERNLKHRASIINFIAAYGTGDAVLEAIPANDLEARRDRAEELYADAAYMDRPAAEVGLDDVDFWVGGLAEKTMVFGGMLGSSFNFVFESQAELLHNADRFYYLTRNQGRNFLAQLEANSFTELIQRNTTATAVPLDIFTHPNHTFLVDDLLDTNNVPITTPDPWPEGLIYANDTVQYDGADHVVIYGRNTHGDRLRGGIGDDTIWGRAGDDTIEGDDGVDSLLGGDGDDIITDINGDDVFIAGSGNDAVRAGAGADLVLTGSGADFTMLTKDDANNAFTGIGDDIILGGTGNDLIWAGDGDDWIEGNTGHDLLQGDNALVFQNDPWGGHDVLLGGPGNNDHDSDGGDDIMVQGPGVDRNEGMLGFDWVTYKDHRLPVDADLGFGVLTPPDVSAVRDRFDLVEGLSGWENNDVLRGMIGIDDVFGRAQNDPNGHELTEAHLDRVIGLREMLQPAGHFNYACRFMIGNVCDIPLSDSDGAANLILGGAGSDLIEGRAGDDFIDGDRWLDVYLTWNKPNGTSERFDSVLQFGDRVLSREIDPADLVITREVVTPADDDSIDTAVYAAPASEYEIRYHGDGYWELFHSGAVELEEGEGRDILRGIEALQFSSDCFVLLKDIEAVPNAPFVPFSDELLTDCGAFGSITLTSQSTPPVEYEWIRGNVTIDDDYLPATNITWVWQFGEEGEEWEPTAIPSTQSNGNLSSEFVPDDPIPANLVRAIVQFTDVDGVLRQIVSPATEAVENVNDLPVPPVLIPDPVAVGDVLTATGFSDADGIESIVEDQTVSYAWEQNSGPGGAWVPILTTSDPWFEVMPGQVGHQVRVVVAYTDDHGTAETAISAPSSVVLGSPPPNSAPTGQLSLLPAVPQVGETVAVDTSAIADADGPAVIAFTYFWYEETAPDVWTAIPGAMTSFFEPTNLQLGKRLKVVATYTDGGGTAESVELITPQVAPPVNPAPAAPTGLAANGGEESITVSWTANTELDLAGYRLYRRNTASVGLVPANLIAELGPGVTSYVDTLPAGVTRHYRLVAVDTAGAASLPTSVVSATVDPAPLPPPDSDFEAVTPGRLFDTRAGSAEGLVAVPKVRLAAGTPLAVKVTDIAGRVPASGVGGVSLNVTAVDPSAGGWLAVVPCGSSYTTSSVNFGAGGATANAVLTAVSAAGEVCFRSSVETDLVVDLTGWFPDTADGFQAVGPERVFDTRPGSDGLLDVAKGKVTPSAELEVDLTDLPDSLLPSSGVGAVSFNVTVAEPDGAGWLAVVPCGSTNTTSSVNFLAGGATANAVISVMPADGRVCFRTSVDTHVIVDINGYFPVGSDFTAVTPDRVFDTRIGPGGGLRSVPLGKLAPNTPLAVRMTDIGDIPATGVGAVSLNVTVTDADAGGWLAVVPCGSSDETSSVNFGAGAATANAVLTAVSSGGEVCFVSSVPAHVIVDVNGWFAG